MTLARLTFRPVLHALRVASTSSLAGRWASYAARGTLPVCRHASTTPPRPNEPVKVIQAKAYLDPAGVYTPSEYVLAQLQTPQVQQFLTNLSSEESEYYNILLQRLNKENGLTDLLALNDIGMFLAERGVELDVPENVFNPSEDILFQETGEEVDYSVTTVKRNTKSPFMSLMTPRPYLDARDVLEIPPDKQNPYGARVTVRNHVSIFDGNLASSESGSNASQPTYALPIREVKELYQSILIARTVKQQTGKGKIMRKYFLVLVGDGNGLVGYGEAKDFNARLALQKARLEAVKNMDWVERFEQRTVWTEMETKLGATRLILRPRPVGFGLRCNPYLHQIMRAAGFKDISAKVWGSRNKLNVIKAAFRMLQAGHAPVGMGDGLGGRGKKLNKGVGMQGLVELERARGRKLISLRK